MPLFIAFIFLATSAVSAVPVRPCPQEISFSHWYDLFMQGSAPELPVLLEKRWQLKGLTSSRFSKLMPATGFDATGFSVAHWVPEIRFATRETLAREGDWLELLSSSVHSTFAVRRNWGNRRQEIGTPIYRTQWKHLPAAVQDSIGLEVSLYDYFGPELFDGAVGDLPRSGSKLALQCRMHGEAMLCLAEYLYPAFMNRRGELTEMFWFEPALRPLGP